MRAHSIGRSRRRGFTLAEVAITIAIVGLLLVLVLQGINEAKMLAAHTRNQRVARELALLTLAQIETGALREEISDERLDGNYADEGYPDFVFEAVIGENNFRDPNDPDSFDNWRPSDEDDDDEEVEQPYEKVQLKVQFPAGEDQPNEIVFERWYPWKQLHPDEDDGSSSSSSSDAAEGGAP